MNFYLMWANHDATTYWDVKNPRVDSIYWMVRWTGSSSISWSTGLYRNTSGSCLPENRREPVFCIYELNTLIQGLGEPSRQRTPSIISERKT
jgi:hypothetical protein